jgi:RNA recognition motif-containing protein
MVKFFSSTHLQVASEKLRYFQTKDGHRIRFLPHDTNLFKAKDTSNMSMSSVSHQNSSFSQKANNSHINFEEDPEALENLPDNSHLECNICVTGLDEALTSEDLHMMFAKFGDIKSCKVTLDPVTGKSRGYGFIWFTTERASRFALREKDMPYKTLLYRDFCLRALEPMVGDQAQQRTVVIAGYPPSFKEKELMQLIGADSIKEVCMKKNRAEITFKSVKLAQSSLAIDGVSLKGSRLSVKPVIASQDVDLSALVGPNNLYIRDLSKEFDEQQVRRAFAKFGKISSFRLLNKSEFTTNVAFVAYLYPQNATLAF